MGLALQLVTSLVLNPGATITACTVNAGESFTVPAFNPSSHGWLLSPFSPGATVGVARIRSPRFHDAAQGIRLQRGAAVFEPLLPAYAMQPIYPSDTLTVEASGGGAETDMVCFLEYFEDLPGIAARLAMWGDIANRIRNISGVEIDLTSGATAGQYGTSKAINATFDTFKANTDYALLGFTASVKVGAVCVFGPDTGNQHVGGPGSITPNFPERGWFVHLSQETGKPMIPIINSNNRGSTNIQIADVGAATNSNITLNLAELG